MSDNLADKLRSEAELGKSNDLSFAAALAIEQRDLFRAKLEEIAAREWECGCEAIGSHACDVAEIRALARDVLALAKECA